MSWLDSVLAVPVVGFEIQPNFRVILNYPQITIPLIEEINSNQGSVTIEGNSFQDFCIKSPKGFSYRFLPNNVTVSFAYPLTQNRILKGGIENISAIEIKPFSQLLTDTIEEFRKTLKILISDNDITFNRFGLVAAINTARSSVPPGITLLIEHLSKPWNKPLVACNVALTAEISDTDLFRDFCHHNFIFNEGLEPDNFNLSLDWQRVVKNENKLTANIIDEQISSYCEAATCYFEIVGEGRLNYD